MNRFYLLCLGSLSIGAVQAQITINSSTHFPDVGESFEYVFTEDPSINVSNNGANQTWDLSGLNSGTTQQFDYVAPNSGVDGANFTSANLLETFEDVENYYVKDANSVSFNGNYISGLFRHTYSDNRELIKFPMFFNKEYNETFSGLLSGIGTGQSLLRQGTISIKGSGYGDLILPFATVSNVLKVMVITDYSDTFLGQVIGNYSDTLIFWFSPTHKSYVATVSKLNQFGGTVDYRAGFMEESDYILSASNDLIGTSELDFYPNPTSSEITLMNTENVKSISILDMKGVMFQSIPVTTKNQKVDVSTLPTGMYFVQYIFNDEVKVKKLVIQ